MSRIVLFTGGARSGKSMRAEQYAARLSEHVTYLATAEAGDDEMRERIAHHRRRRPAAWKTIEAPRNVAAALASLAPGSVVLLDCLSLLVSNLLLAHEDDPAPFVEQELSAILKIARRACVETYHRHKRGWYGYRTGISAWTAVPRSARARQSAGRRRRRRGLPGGMRHSG
jgi:adenosyl cobinamide kinase/adenosyl cobinamide phosphate guanylyltransferase